MQVFNRHVSAKGLTVFSVETLLISGTMLLAAQAHGSLGTAMSALWKIGLATAVCELCFYYNDLYDLTAVHPKAELLVRVMRAAGTAALVLAAISLALPAITMGHGVFLTSVGLLLVIVPAWRLAFDGLTRDPHLEERVLIVGTGPIAKLVARQVQAQHDFAYRVVGYLSDTDDAGTDADDLDLPLLGSAADVARLAGLHQINRIVVGISDRRGHLPIQELLRAKLSGVRIEDAATYQYERITGKILTDGLAPSWFIFSDGFGASRSTRAFKRLMDIALAAVGPRARGAADAPDRHCGEARLPRPDLLQTGARRRERSAVHAVQVPLDAHRRRKGHADLGDRAKTAASRRWAASSASRGWTSFRSC